MKDIQKEKEEKKKNRLVVYIFILIVILLSLITSCSCTSKFFGKIGDLFKNEGTFILNNDAGDQEIIRNKNLKFDKDTLEISLSDYKTKLSYSYENINPDELTCTTSDANIATCYVKKGYVVINPKAVGTVTITLQTNANGKTYEATATVIITEALKKLSLANNSGTINLRYTNQKIVPFNLIGITGNVEVISSDKSIATATIKNGVMKITAKKTGKVEFTLSVICDGKTYTATYKLTVINSKTGENTDKNKPSDSKGTNNYLANLTSKKYPLNEEFNKNNNYYTIDVPYNENKITLIATPENSSSSKITYSITNSQYPNGKKLDNLDDIPLEYGDNTIKITVVSENGEPREYIVVIHKPIRTIIIDGDNHSMNIEDGKYTIGYHIYDDKNEVFDYDINNIDLTTNFLGQVTLNKGFITLKPDNSMLDQKNANLNLTIKDNKAYDNTNINVQMGYYIGGKNQVKDYNIPYLSPDDKSKTIIIDTNIFAGEKDGVTSVFDPDKKILTICSKTNITTCINIKAEGNIDSLEYKSGSGENSLEILVNGNIDSSGIGNGKLIVSGNAYDHNVPDSFEIDIKINQKFNVNISANPEYYKDKEVFFAEIEKDTNGNITNLIKLTEKENDTVKYLQEYQKQITGSGNDVIDLAKYHAFMASDNSCEYYPVKAFNTKEDGSGKEYSIQEVISLANKNLVNNLKLYAIYDLNNPISIKGSIEEGPLIEYLSFEDAKNITEYLFYNKEFAKYYGQNANDSSKKIIYPGVSGVYDMYYINDTNNEKIITGLTLEEIDTICVNEKGTKGCLSMAYQVLYNGQNYYGNNDRYSILNKGVKGSKEIIDLPNIKLNPHDQIGIQLKWKWVEEDEKYNTSDKLDTLIGNKAAEKAQDMTINDLYKLRVGIRFTTKETTCK